MRSMFASPPMFSFRGSMARPAIFIVLHCSLAGAALALADSLDEADGRAGEVEFLAQAVFEKALVTEVQFLPLVRKKNERRRRGGRLRNVINLYAMRRR